MRTSGPSTLRLAATLNAAGIEAWTPMQTVKRQKPRSKVKVDLAAPMLPTFVFARAQYLDRLAEARRLPASPHPGFSIFSWTGQVPFVADRDIANLRELEERAAWSASKKQPAPFTAGEGVEIVKGAATGLSGIVETCDGQFALVAFGGSFRMKIATLLLRTETVHAD